MPNTYAREGVSNPNVPIFPPRVCTLVLFIQLSSCMYFKAKLSNVVTMCNDCSCVYVHVFCGMYSYTFPCKYNCVHMSL